MIARPLASFVSPSASTTGAVVVRGPHGERIAEARRRGSSRQARWRWSARDAGLGTFVVEPTDADGRRWLVTRTDAAPFGELTVVGRRRRRLRITDGSGRHLTVGWHGTVRDDRRRLVARMSDDPDGRVRLEVHADLDRTWQTLLLAATTVRPSD